MELNPTLVVQVALFCVVGGTQTLRYPILFNLPVQSPVAPAFSQSNLRFGTYREESLFPCTKTGLFPNPQDCTRFYGCMANEDNGVQYVRSHYKCSNDHIFYAPYQSCLPGNCQDGVYSLPSKNSTLAAEHNQIEITGEDYSLPCPQQEFDVHPKNCSRFYRCVDYGGYGVYKRYLFECPNGYIFLPGSQQLGTELPCYRGICVDLYVPPSLSSTESPSDQSEQTTDSFFGLEESTVTEEPVTELSPMTEDRCPYKFVQHSLYCNVYILCDDPSVRYSCPTGTAFVTSRQMCRITAADDGHCDNKEIFKHEFLLRSENTGTHVRLPDYLFLPTALPAWSDSGPSYVGQRKRPTPRPHSLKPTAVQSHGWPTPFQAQSDFDERQPVFRPLISRPAQVYSRPDDSQSTFGSSFNNIRPVNQEHVYSALDEPVLPNEEKVFRPLFFRPGQAYSQLADEDYQPDFVGDHAAYRPLISRPAQVYRRPENTQPTLATFYGNLRPPQRIVQTPAATRPLAEVRDPIGHLHFPHFGAYNIFASRSEDEEP